MTAPITWAEASSPIYWSNIGINWNSPAKTDTSAFISNLGYTQLGILDIDSSGLFAIDVTDGKESAHTIVESIAYGLNNGFTSLGGFTLNELAGFGISLDEVFTGILSNAVASANYGITNNYINNTKFPESASISMSMTFSNGNSFLWNDVSDPSTIWTDVSDPTSIWTKESDPTSTWTKIDYPN